MCKFGFIFLQLYFSLPRVWGQSEIVLGQSGLNQNSQIYDEFYFLKFNLTHKP